MNFVQQMQLDNDINLLIEKCTGTNKQELGMASFGRELDTAELAAFFKWTRSRNLAKVKGVR